MRQQSQILSVPFSNKEWRILPIYANENSSCYHTLSLYSGILNQFNIYNHWIIYNTFNFGLILHRHIDRGLIELIGPTGFISFIHYIGFRLELLATGYLPHYAFTILFSILICLVCILQFITVPFYLILLFLFIPVSTSRGDPYERLF
jgi:hypothetical protein